MFHPVRGGRELHPDIPDPVCHAAMTARHVDIGVYPAEIVPRRDASTPRAGRVVQSDQVVRAGMVQSCLGRLK
jgi:hypothetical protein